MIDTFEYLQDEIYYEPPGKRFTSKCNWTYNSPCCRPFRRPNYEPFDSVIEALNHYGSYGWEVVNFTPSYDDTYWVLFKRKMVTNEDLPI